MAYTKMLIDNPTCSRRFHITFDSEDPQVEMTEVHCSYCGVTIFQATDHPKVRLAREENLIKTAALSEHLVYECAFEDKFPEHRPSSATAPEGSAESTSR